MHPRSLDSPIEATLLPLVNALLQTNSNEKCIPQGFVSCWIVVSCNPILESLIVIVYLQILPSPVMFLKTYQVFINIKKFKCSLQLYQLRGGKIASHQIVFTHIPWFGEFPKTVQSRTRPSFHRSPSTGQTSAMIATRRLYRCTHANNTSYTF